MVDATLVAVRTSTKNRDGKCGPEIGLDQEKRSVVKAGVRLRIKVKPFRLVPLFLFLSGCLTIDTKEYPAHWPNKARSLSSDCLQIEGLYLAVGESVLGGEQICHEVVGRTWERLEEATDLSCFSLPSALDIDAEVTSKTPIKIEQTTGRLVIEFVDKKGTERRYALERGNDYECRPNKILLVQPDEQTTQSWKIGVGKEKLMRKFYKGSDGSLLYRESYSIAGPIFSPPFALGGYVKSWARWRMISEESPSPSLKNDASR